MFNNVVYPPFFYFSIIPLFYYIDIWELLQKENFNEGLPIFFHGQQNPFKMGVLHEGKYSLWESTPFPPGDAHNEMVYDFVLEDITSRWSILFHLKNQTWNREGSKCLHEPRLRLERFLLKRGSNSGPLYQ